MEKKIFVNLPVKDLKKSMQFFSQLGFEFNKQFTNEQGACMVISDSIFTMLLDEKFFKTFIKKEVSDAKKSTEVLIALSADSRKEVDEMVEKAVKAGGTTYRPPEDLGFMYQHAFEDLDGHIWEVFWMDPSHVQ
ncbi:VOC family protein [Bdellovibrio sp. 22V]|uniref:VOC family protein n=1 Tax=Bdellovibrio TaxID=958 RepID=UPI0025432B92|nr:VOC family protein [Bdellovibrio sp. 22V]WII72612.1 VOC family protein [Bdellovibrio sp. 22V]